MAERITVKRASILTGMSELSIREGIRCGALEFGRAIPSKEGKRFNFHISPKLLADYLGIPVEEVKEETNQEVE